MSTAFFRFFRGNRCLWSAGRNFHFHLNEKKQPMVALNRKQTAMPSGKPPLRAVFTEIRRISPLFALDDDTWYRALGAAIRCLAAGLSVEEAARRVIAEVGEA